MEGRPVLTGTMKLACPVDELLFPASAIGEMVTRLVTSFLANGGDFSQPTEIRFTTETVGPEGEESERLFARLHGWGTSRSSSSVTNVFWGS